MIFAFDLHNVILLPDRRKMLALYWQARHQYACWILMNPRVLYQFYLALNNRAYAEAYYDEIARKYLVFKVIKPFFALIINAQKINKPVVATIKDLKNRGYTVYMASNIWTSVFPDLKRQYGSIVDLFDAVYYPSSENGKAYKPHKAYYERFMARYGIRAFDIIFIDDERRNIYGAQACGWQCILYINPEDLKKHLDKKISTAMLFSEKKR